MRHLLRAHERSRRRHDSQFVAVHDRGDRLAVGGPGQLSKIGQSFLAVPQPAPRSSEAIVRRPTCLRRVSVGENRAVVRTPHDVSNLGFAGRQSRPPVRRRRSGHGETVLPSRQSSARRVTTRRRDRGNRRGRTGEPSRPTRAGSSRHRHGSGLPRMRSGRPRPRASAGPARVDRRATSSVVCRDERDRPLVGERPLKQIRPRVAVHVAADRQPEEIQHRRRRRPRLEARACTRRRCATDRRRTP